MTKKLNQIWDVSKDINNISPLNVLLSTLTALITNVPKIRAGEREKHALSSWLHGIYNGINIYM